MLLSSPTSSSFSNAAQLHPSCDRLIKMRDWSALYILLCCGVNSQRASVVQRRQACSTQTQEGQAADEQACATPDRAEGV